MSNCYWKVTGPPKDKIKAVFKQLNDCLDRAADYAESFGARPAYSYGFQLKLCFVFDTQPDMKVWSKDKHGNYHPKKSSSQGKLVASKLKEIEKDCPYKSEIGNAITSEKGYGQLFQSPGVSLCNDDVYVVTGDFYSPPESLAEHIVRISDIEFEKATKEPKSKRKDVQ